MDHGRERIHRLVIHQNRHFHEVILAVASHLIVKGRIAFGHRFQTVIEVKDHLIQRQIIDHHGAGARVGEVFLDAATVLAQLQHVAEVVIGHKNCRFDARFFEVVDLGHVRHVGGVVHLDHLTRLVIFAFHIDVIDHRRRGGDEVDVIFTLDPVADDFEVQQAEEAAAEAKAQRGRGFHFV